MGKTRKIGQTFSRWTVVGHSKLRSYCLCQCECGTIKDVHCSSLVAGTSVSCGCRRREMLVERNYKHGLSKTPAMRTFYESTREARKVNVTPKWANLEKVKEIYLNCPKGMTVDHIIHLQGKLVCGLHVETNLQYLSLSENSKKSFKFIPQTY